MLGSFALIIASAATASLVAAAAIGETDAGVAALELGPAADRAESG